MNVKTKRYVIMTADPLHVGTGGYRLGLVDQSIVREPGTNLPKIPGTSLHGAIRSHAAYLYNKSQCAGSSTGQEKDKKHCASDKCPICSTFGYVTDVSTGNKGVVSISDARILFFPVYSMKGPVWVTTAQTLKETGVPVELDPESAFTTMENTNQINLGWLMVEIKGAVDITSDFLASPEWNTIKERIVIIPEELFSLVVNSNLEIRTSVSIAPETGAAEDRALFTYEAIPRSAFLWFDAVQDDYRKKFPPTEKAYHKENGDNAGEPLTFPWNMPIDVVTAGLELAEHLGIGGMGTRGFGRVRIIKTWGA